MSSVYTDPRLRGDDAQEIRRFSFSITRFCLYYMDLAEFLT